MASSSWMRKKGFVTLTTGDNIMKLSFTFPSTFWQNSPGSFFLATHLDLIHDKDKIRNLIGLVLSCTY
jgi:hypothetical protein